MKWDGLDLGGSLLPRMFAYIVLCTTHLEITPVRIIIGPYTAGPDPKMQTRAWPKPEYSFVYIYT